VRAEERVLEYESSVRGEDIGMSIDESALAHIMSVLTDLYSDPELAVLREYATNALDAHIEAGESRPIEISLPTSLAPFVRIRDYGNGLDARDIREVFSRYGTSTKRDSDDVVGMLGLGCKSALSYADQFTLTGVKDGVRTEVLVSRDEDGAGTMTIVDSSPSSDPSGTEIVVPAKSGHGFEEKAADLFRFWTPGSVLVNGRAPKRIGGMYLADDFLITEETDEDIIVMGNVPYPVPDEYASRRKYGYGMRHRTVAFVDIGTISFTPSREALQLTKRTKSALEAVAARREALVQSECARMIEEAATPADAIRISGEANRIGYKGAGTYRGRPVPTSLDRRPRDASGNLRASNPDETPAESFLVSGAMYGKKNGSREWTTDFGIVAIFVGYSSRYLSPTKREKIASYMESRSLVADASRRKIVLCERLSADERFWTEGIPVVRWEDVDAIKIARADRPAILDGGRPRGSYAARLPDGTWTEGLPADEIDTSAPLFYLHGNRGAVSAHVAIREDMVADGATVVALPGNRLERFVRDFPTAVSLDVHVRRFVKDWTTTVSEDAITSYILAVSGREIERLRGLDADAILDPVLREYVRLANVDTSAVSSRVRAYRDFLPESFLRRETGDSVLREYPLVDHSYGGLQKYADETTIYVNASYLARTKGADVSAPEGR
jgi:hypothetical protein